MIDTHAHLNFPELSTPLPEILKRAEAAGVNQVIVPGTNAETSTSAVNLAEVYPSVFAGIGIHPSDAHQYGDEERKKLLELFIQTNSVVSVGEVGLDYYRLESEGDLRDNIDQKKIRQKNVFLEMLDLAKQYQLPLIIHTRDAFADTFAILNESAKGHPSVIHCFSGTLEQARQWLAVGFLLSFTGMITYKKNDELREVVKEVPLSRIMLETDAPFLAPEGLRGQVCEPAHVRQVAECVAQVKGISLAEVDHVTTATARQFFKI